ncbi:MAG: NAD(P)-dependent oxidoreductase, partial [Proteobacteria bacterium]|nr:NAD(P)-dependent oxidoreductase [Pseudomonadota bacterium]
AKGGTLAIFVGGDEETFRKCRPILEAMGSDVDHVGEIGAGEVVKLVNNLVLAVNVCALAEGLVLGVKAGVRPDVLFKALNQGSADSYALQNHFKKFVFKGRFEKGVFPVEYIIKDLDLALTTAENYQLPQKFGALARDVYESALSDGLGGLYYPVVVKVLEKLAGVEVRADLED